MVSSAQGIGTVVQVTQTSLPWVFTMHINRLEELRADCLADDIGIEDEMLSWSEAEVMAFFESGGVERPFHIVPAQTTASNEPLPPLIWWKEASQPRSIFSHKVRVKAHSDKISRVRLMHDECGTLGMPGLVAVSGSWDYTVRLWRVGGTGPGDESPVKLAELNHTDTRWVYDVATCGRVGDEGDSIGVISTHTGGMVGEPQHLIRMWRVTGGAAAGDDAATGACEQLLNVDGATSAGHQNGDGANFGHLRGVHACDCNGRHAVTMSTDRLLAWSLDRSTFRGAELARITSPLAASAVPVAVRLMADGRSVLPVGEGIVHEATGATVLPILDLGAGLTTADVLEFKPKTACDAIELLADQRNGAGGDAPAGARIVVAGANRAFLYDRRAGARPCSRLPVQGIKALASLSGAATGVPPVLLASVDRQVLVFDVRRLPEDTPAAKKAPPALATLALAEGASSGEMDSFSTIAAEGRTVVAASHEGGVAVWDVGAPEAQAPAAPVMGVE